MERLWRRRSPASKQNSWVIVWTPSLEVVASCEVMKCRDVAYVVSNLYLVIMVSAGCLPSQNSLVFVVVVWSCGAPPNLFSLYALL